MQQCFIKRLAGLVGLRFFNSYLNNENNRKCQEAAAYKQTLKITTALTGVMLRVFIQLILCQVYATMMRNKTYTILI